MPSAVPAKASSSFSGQASRPATNAESEPPWMFTV